MFSNASQCTVAFSSSELLQPLTTVSSIVTKCYMFLSPTSNWHKVRNHFLNFCIPSTVPSKTYLLNPFFLVKTHTIYLYILCQFIVLPKDPSQSSLTYLSSVISCQSSLCPILPATLNFSLFPRHTRFFHNPIPTHPLSVVPSPHYLPDKCLLISQDLVQMSTPDSPNQTQMFYPCVPSAFYSRLYNSNFHVVLQLTRYIFVSLKGLYIPQEQQQFIFPLLPSLTLHS